MVTNISAINDKFSELVSFYLSIGYKICPNTMRGSQSDAPIKVDMYLVEPKKKGCHFVRVYRIDDSVSWSSELGKRGYSGNIFKVVVAYGHLNRIPKDGSFNTIWNSELQTEEEYVWYTVGSRWQWGYTTDVEEALACEEKNNERYRTRERTSNVKKTYTDIEHLRVGLKAVKKQPRTKSIHLENIERVAKINKHYTVYYTTPSGKSTSLDIG